MPKVSVIMGVYNTPKEYLKKAIDSMINQTFNDYEFIICDDGSTDGCFDYIKKMYGENEKVILICNSKNKGLTYTLNHCLSIAKGKYIARMDADDFSHCDRIEKQVKFLEENEEIGLVNCNINIFDDNGIYGERINNYIIKKEDFLKNNPIIHPAVLFKKSEIDKVSGYRDIPMTVRNEDYDLFMRMMANGTKMRTIQEKLFDFREDKESYKRRKYRYRINEFNVRKYGYKILKMYPIGYIFMLKPIIVRNDSCMFIKKD